MTKRGFFFFFSEAAGTQHIEVRLVFSTGFVL